MSSSGPKQRRLSGFGGTTTASATTVRNTHVQLTPMYAGIAAYVLDDGLTLAAGISIHDGSYTIDNLTDKIKFTQHPSKAPGCLRTS